MENLVYIGMYTNTAADMYTRNMVDNAYEYSEYKKKFQIWFFNVYVMLTRNPLGIFSEKRMILKNSVLKSAWQVINLFLSAAGKIHSLNDELLQKAI